MTYDRRYMQWKGWQGEFSYDLRQEECFTAEFKNCSLKGLRILEIGFGNGAFLAWARKHGAHVSGTELILELVEIGRMKGIDVFHGQVDEVEQLTGREFDLIVAFDVFEHIEIERLKLHLKLLRNLLSERGEIICRFPNGESPFGRIYQHADVTHVSVLSGPIMSQLCQEAGLAVIESRNAYRYRGTGPKGFLRLILYLLRDVLHFCIDKIYLIGTTSLDPTTVVRIGLPK